MRCGKDCTRAPSQERVRRGLNKRPPIKLNIELDGSQHYTKEGIKKDLERDENLSNDGIEVMRFTNDDVLKNIDGVGEAISEKIQEKLKNQMRAENQPPSPLRRGKLARHLFWRG